MRNRWKCLGVGVEKVVVGAISYNKSGQLHRRGNIHEPKNTGTMKTFLHRRPTIGGKYRQWMSGKNREASCTRREPMAIPAVASGAVAVGAFAIGALSIGALAIGAVAIGRLVIGRLFIKKAKFGTLEIGTLKVGKLEVAESGGLEVGLKESSGE